MKILISKEEAAALLTNAVNRQFLEGSSLHVTELSFDHYSKDGFVVVKVGEIAEAIDETRHAGSIEPAAPRTPVLPDRFAAVDRGAEGI
jgi:hypothetical protein